VSGVGDGFAWAFRDPAWLGKFLLQGLIAFIPLVGWIAMAGWMMLTYDNVRAGKNELPPAGFHLGRGIGIVLVYLIYGIVLAIPGSILIVLGSAYAANSSNSTGLNPGSPILSLGILLAVASGLFLRFLQPALIVNTARAGIAGGMDVQRVWRDASANVGNSIIAGLVIFVASLIGGLGVSLCLIPLLFTVPYENVITAGAAAWFEKAPDPAPAPTAAA